MINETSKIMDSNIDDKISSKQKNFMEVQMVIVIDFSLGFGLTLI